MKVGDLITLSAYGKRLSHVARHMTSRKWGQHNGEDRPIIGLVTKVTPPVEHRPWDKQNKYSISWIGEKDPLKGREHYISYFNRKDLKMVSKA